MPSLRFCLGLAASLLTAHAHAQTESACGPTWYPGATAAGTNAFLIPICLENYDSVRVVDRWDPDGAGPRPSVVVCGGLFEWFGDAKAANIVAINPQTGSSQPFGAGTDGAVSALAVLPNGDLVIGGSFSQVDGVASLGTAIFSVSQQRWISTGVTGQPKSNCRPPVSRILPLPDGRFFVVGEDTAGSTPLAAARTFDPATGLWTTVATCNNRISDAVQTPDGYVYVGIPQHTISFRPRVGPSLSGSLFRVDLNAGTAIRIAVPTFTQVTALAATPDGQLIGGGELPTSSPRSSIFRIDPATATSTSLGAVTFPPIGREETFPRRIHVLDDGRVLVAGGFQQINSVPLTGGLAQYDPATATWSRVGDLLGGWVSDISVSNGAILACGSPVSAEGPLARIGLLPAGAATWTPLDDAANGGVRSLARDLDGSVLAAGSFTRLDGVTARGVARYINEENRWEPVGPGPSSIGFDANIHSLLVSGDGDIYIAARTRNRFTGRDVYVSRYMRELDEWYEPPQQPNSYANLALEDDDGSIIIAGLFSSIGGQPFQRIARYVPQSDSWQAITPLMSGANVFSGATLGGGRILLGGRFQSQSSSFGFLRVFDPITQTWSSPPGIPDSTLNGRVTAVKKLQNGDVLVSGVLGTVNGVSTYDLIRIPADGSTAEAIDLPNLNEVTFIDEFDNSDLFLAATLRNANADVIARAVRVNPSTLTVQPFIPAWDSTAPSAYLLDANNVYVGGGPNSDGPEPFTVFSRFSPDGLPWIARQPESPGNQCPGASVTISVAIAAGTGDADYQWFKDAVAIDPLTNPSAATSTLQLDALRANDDGVYTAVLTNACGSTTSAPATLRVCVADLDCSGEVDLSDFLSFFNCFDALDPCADLDDDDIVDMGDFHDFFHAYDSEC